MVGKNLKLVPAQLKKIVKNNNEYWLLLFDLTDFFKIEDLSKNEKKILTEFKELLNKICKLLPHKKPSKIERKRLWQIGDMIETKKNAFIKNYGVYITNFIEAVATELNLASRTVNFFVQFRYAIPISEVYEDVPWKVYQTALLLKDKTKVKFCINLYRNGKLKNIKDVLNFVKQYNNNYKN